MTGERKTELDKDALEKARDAFILAKYGFLDDVLRTRIAAAISAYLAALPSEGWKLVPVEATPTMAHVGNCTIGDNIPKTWPEGDALAAEIYRAMLAAAPPLTPGEQK